MSSPAAEARIPRQIPFIIGNEGCERFSFYGMRNILTVFLVSSLLADLPEAERGGAAKDVFHTFVIGVYFFPLLGGWLADRFLGKYRTIFWLSLVYCLGHLCLALFEASRTGFYVGLGLIALGAGGIKPCVSAFVGDQFDQSNKHRARVVFDAFYWIINFGSFFASLLMPIFLRRLGPAVAFGIPGALMAVSTLVLWLGRHRYVMVPPAPPDPHSFLRVARSAVGAGLPGKILAAVGAVGAAASSASRRSSDSSSPPVAPWSRSLALAVWRWAASSTARGGAIRTKRSKGCARCCGCSCCSPSSLPSGRFSTKRRPRGCCRPTA